MTKKQLVKALQYCSAVGMCDDCWLTTIKKEFGSQFCDDKLKQEAADLIEQQAARIKKLEAKVPSWIPVTERLPEVHQNSRKSDAMLVYTRRKLFMVAVWNGIDWLAPMDFWDAWGDEIVCWMPLPEPPEMDGGGEDG